MRHSLCVILGAILAAGFGATRLAAAEPTATAIIGGEKGFAFRELAPPGGRLIGITVGLISSGPASVMGLRPIYAVGDRTEEGSRFGTANDSVRVVAKPGYAVGAIVLASDGLVRGMRLTFFRIADERLDPQDRYESRWLGGRGGAETTLGGDGRNIVGLAGRTSQSLTALGLLLGDLSAGDAEATEPEFHSTPDYEAAVAEVRQWGVPLVFDDSLPDKPLVSLELPGRYLTERKLQLLGRLTSLRRLKLTGSVSRQHGGGLAPLANLKRLKELDLNGVFWFRDGEIALVRNLPWLERIDLRGTEVTAEGLQHLVPLKRLKSLHLSSTYLRDAAMETIVRLKSLEDLTIHDTDLTDEAFVQLVALPGLKKLQLSSGWITDRGVAPLAKLKQLTHLGLRGREFTPAALKELRDLKLTSLHLGGLSITDEALEVFSGQTGVEQLWLVGTRLTDDGLKALAGMKLQRIEVVANRFNGRGFAAVSGENLTEFVSRNSHLAAPVAEWLGKCPKIESLDLENSEVSDTQLKSLAGCTALRRLRLDGNPLSDEGIRNLAPLQALRELHVAQSTVTGDGVDALPNLEVLVLSQTGVSNVELDAIAKLGKLRHLDLNRCRQISDRGVVKLAGLTGLRKLGLQNTRLTNAACETLVKLAELEELDVGGTKIDDQGAPQLATLVKLRALGINATPITDAGLAQLMALPQLATIFAINGRLTDEGLKKAREKRYYLDSVRRDFGPDQYLEK